MENRKWFGKLFRYVCMLTFAVGCTFVAVGCSQNNCGDGACCKKDGKCPADYKKPCCAKAADEKK